MDIKTFIIKVNTNKLDTLDSNWPKILDSIEEMFKASQYHMEELSYNFLVYVNDAIYEDSPGNVLKWLIWCIFDKEAFEGPKPYGSSTIKDYLKHKGKPLKLIKEYIKSFYDVPKANNKGKELFKIQINAEKNDMIVTLGRHDFEEMKYIDPDYADLRYQDLLIKNVEHDLEDYKLKKKVVREYIIPKYLYELAKKGVFSSSNLNDYLESEFYHGALDYFLSSYLNGIISAI